MLAELKHALRILRKYPLANTVIVFTIACLVAVIGLFYGSFKNVRQQLMPFEDPDRFVRLWRANEVRTSTHFSGDLFQRFQREAKSFDKIGALNSGSPFTLKAKGNPRTLVGVYASAEVLELAGKAPLLGRLFTKADERPGNDSVVILGEKVWRRDFEASEDVLGNTIELNEQDYTVIGVVPESLERTRLASLADIWIPYEFSFDSTKSGQRSGDVVGRLKPGVDLETAQAEFKVFAQHIAADRPKTDHEGNALPSFGTLKWYALDENPASQRPSQMAYQDFFALGLIACVVLIACFNMTCLFLLQATSRAREMAVRLAVGASRSRIVRQMLVESVLLAVLGGLCGLAISLALLKLSEVKGYNFVFDPMLYALVFGSAMGIGALVALIPALRAGRTAVSMVLKDGGQSSASRTRHGFRNFLVGSQMSMVTILTITSVLFTQSFLATLNSETKFDPQRLTAVPIPLSSFRYEEAGQIDVYTRNALQAVSEMPGVERVAVTKPDFRVSSGLQRGVTFADKSRSEIHASVGVIETSPDLFAILGQRTVQGRPFSEGNEVLNEAIVNAEFVKRFSEGGNLLNQQFSMPGVAPQSLTIVGVVENRSPQLNSHGATPLIFVSHRHATDFRGLGILVESKADAASFAPAIRETLKRLDANQVIGEALLVSDLIADQMAPLRFRALMMLGVAGFAMFMALMGVYGVVAYAVIERTREMGIRMALGATRRKLVMTVMSEGTRLLLWGGVPASFLAVAAILQMPERSFPGIDLANPVHYLIGVTAVAIAGILAALLPARKIVNLNPTQALRHE